MAHGEPATQPGDEHSQLEGLGHFASGISQRLNSLLIGILGNTSLALAEGSHNPQLAAILGEIEHGAQQARGLTGQLMALAGRSVRLAELPALNQLVTSVLAEALNHFPPHLEFVSTLEPGLPPLLADSAQLGHALRQLIDNASEAYGELPGTVRVSTGLVLLEAALPQAGGGDLDAGRYAYIEVADGAGGIALELLPRLFEPFSVGREAGRGLGLPTVQGIARAHHGGLQLAAQPGAGTTVRLLLPLTRPAPVAAPTRGCVLVIDDDALALSLAAGTLRRAGYSVHCAHGGVEGLALFEQLAGTVDAVLLDLVMPGLDGIETGLALHALDSRLPLILHSGYADQQLQARCTQLRPNALLSKPYPAAALLEALEQALHPRARIELLKA